jgi:hypothetical protein
MVIPEHQFGTLTDIAYRPQRNQYNDENIEGKSYTSMPTIDF